VEGTLLPYIVFLFLYFAAGAQCTYLRFKDDPCRCCKLAVVSANIAGHLQDEGIHPEDGNYSVCQNVG
jgi:hypothetical protein